MMSVKPKVYAPCLMLALLLGAAACLAGCPSWLGTYDEVNSPADDVAFEKCRVEARAEKQIYGDGDRAAAAYFACTDDAGLPRPTTRPR
jgi:hypothetical protein